MADLKSKPSKSLHRKSPPPVMVLDEQLRSVTPVEVDSARTRYHKEKLQSFPPEEPPTNPRARGLEPGEFGDAAVTLRSSVDRICEALVVLFGRLADVSREVQRGAGWYRYVVRMFVLSFILSVATAVLVFIISLQIVQLRTAVSVLQSSVDRALVR